MESKQNIAPELNVKQKANYDKVIGVCPEAVLRENYDIVWITKEP